MTMLSSSTQHEQNYFTVLNYRFPIPKEEGTSFAVGKTDSEIFRLL
jgi:hypothetical protein